MFGIIYFRKVIIDYLYHDKSTYPSKPLALQIFKKFPKIKEEELWDGAFWTGGGHIDTIGDRRALDEVKKYVKNQGRDISQLTLDEFN